MLSNVVSFLCKKQRFSFRLTSNLSFRYFDVSKTEGLLYPGQRIYLHKTYFNLMYDVFFKHISDF